MVKRYSSRWAGLYETFLKKRLAGARRYHRIAGYFQSSLLELAGEELTAISEVRIICNTEVSPEDVKTVRMATGPRRKELEEGLLRLAWNSGGSRTWWMFTDTWLRSGYAFFIILSRHQKMKAVYLKSALSRTQNSGFCTARVG